VTRIDPKTSRVVETIPVGARPLGIVRGHDAIWVANAADDTIARIDPSP
jgi:streptogramin lyase